MGNVKTIIDNWDPIDLLSHAPNDEYHLEIIAIEELLNSSDDISISYLADGIYNIFLKSFGKEIFQKTKSECALVAKKILS